MKKLVLAGVPESEHVAILWYTITDGAVGLHYHAKTESVYVIEGNVRYHIAGETHEGGPGTVFYVPARIEENFEPAGAETVRLLVIYTPGGMDKFFKEAGEPAQRREVPPPSDAAPDLERLSAIAEKHGLKLKVPARA